MLLSGDLDAPLQGLGRARRIDFQCRVRHAKGAWPLDKSYGWLCSGVWEHGPQTPQPHDVTNQFLRFRPCPYEVCIRIEQGCLHLRSLMEFEGLAKLRNQRLCKS